MTEDRLTWTREDIALARLLGSPNKRWFLDRGPQSQAFLAKWAQEHAALVGVVTRQLQYTQPHVWPCVIIAFVLWALGSSPRWLRFNRESDRLSPGERDELFQKLSRSLREVMVLAKGPNASSLIEGLVKINNAQDVWFLLITGPVDTFTAWDYARRFSGRLGELELHLTRKSLHHWVKWANAQIETQAKGLPPLPATKEIEGFKSLNTEEDYRRVGSRLKNCTWWFYWVKRIRPDSIEENERLFWSEREKVLVAVAAEPPYYGEGEPLAWSYQLLDAGYFSQPGQEPMTLLEWSEELERTSAFKALTRFMERIQESGWSLDKARPNPLRRPRRYTFRA